MKLIYDDERIVLTISDSNVSGIDLLNSIKTNDFMLKTIKKIMGVKKLTRLTVDVFSTHIEIVRIDKIPCQFCGELVYSRSPFPVCSECWKINKFDEMDGDVTLKEYNLF